MRDMAFSEGSPYHTLFIRLVNASVPAASAAFAALIATTIVFPSAPPEQALLGLQGSGEGGAGGGAGARPPSRGLVPALEAMEVGEVGYAPPRAVR
jgi:hypothetical protein